MKDGRRNGRNVNERTYYGHTIKVAPDYGGPLFWVHYSHLGLNPNGLEDRHVNYGDEAKSIAKIHHAYAVDNPMNFPNYSSKCWGLTASDEPGGYSEHRPMYGDNGTVTPTAALGSFPYTPEESLEALKYFYRERGGELFGRYGFYDAFNDKENEVVESYIGIDQGPIIVMIENYRSQLLWDTFMKDEDVRQALNDLEFKSVVTSITESPLLNNNDNLLKVFPVPCSDYINVELGGLAASTDLFLRLLSMNGKTIINKRMSVANLGTNRIDLSHVPTGNYILQVMADKKLYAEKIVVQ